MRQSIVSSRLIFVSQNERYQEKLGITGVCTGREGLLNVKTRVMRVVS